MMMRRRRRKKKRKRKRRRWRDQEKLTKIIQGTGPISTAVSRGMQLFYGVKISPRQQRQWGEKFMKRTRERVPERMTTAKKEER